MKKIILFIVLIVLLVFAIFSISLRPKEKYNVVTGGEILEQNDDEIKPNIDEVKPNIVEKIDSSNKNIQYHIEDIKAELAESSISSEVEESPEMKSKIYKVPENTGFKSYMDYRTITAKNSYQYKLQDQFAYTGNYGIRMVEGRYCIAVGTYFTTDVGCYIDLVLENGTVIPCILADVKADIHTDKMNIASLYNGCVSEFIVDTPSLHKIAKRNGSISYCCEEWKSHVAEIIVYEKNIFD